MMGYKSANRTQGRQSSHPRAVPLANAPQWRMDAVGNTVGTAPDHPRMLAPPTSMADDEARKIHEGATQFQEIRSQCFCCLP